MHKRIFSLRSRKGIDILQYGYISERSLPVAAEQELLLLNGNTLCKVSRLVHIAPPHDGDVVGQELERNDVDDG